MNIANYFKSILLGAAFAAFVSVPQTIRAAEETYVCGQSYGQPVVCGVKVPEEEALIVKAGLAEDLRLLGAALLVGSLILFIKAKRAKPTSFNPVYFG